MAMVRVAPVDVRVRTDWFSGAPREITWGEDRLPVTRVVAVRDERSAYPAITGPRTMFEVDTPSVRLSLTFRHRSRRWTIGGLDESRSPPDRPPHAGPRLLPVGPGVGCGRARALARAIRGPDGPLCRRRTGPHDCDGPSLQSSRGSSNRFRDLTVAGFVERLASAEPVPGGGSAAAVAGSLAAALVAMVASLSEGRPKYAEHAALHADALASARELADRFLALADEDAEAFAGFATALKLPRETDAEQATRTDAIRQAARAASQVPYRTVQACYDTAALAEALAGRSNRNASSDLEVSALLSVAASQAAAANVYVNLPSIEDEATAGELLADTERLVHEIDRLADHTREVVRGGSGRESLGVTRA
jgi:formiminotetrahydrofolate cyclodeaminase